MKKKRVYCFVLSVFLILTAQNSVCYEISEEKIKSAQQAFKWLGYEIDSIDGMNSDSLTRVIKQFQKDNNLKITGILDKKTQEKYDSKNFPIAVKLSQCSYVSFENIDDAYGHNSSFRPRKGKVGVAVLFHKKFAMGMKIPIRNFSIHYTLNGEAIQTNCVGMSTGMASKKDYTNWTLETRGLTHLMLMYPKWPYFKLLFSVEKEVKTVTVLYNNEVLVKDLNIAEQPQKKVEPLVIKAVPPSTPVPAKPAPAAAVPAPKAKPEPKPIPDKRDEIIQYICTHLGIEGYKIKKLEKTIELTHPDRWNFYIQKKAIALVTPTKSSADGFPAGLLVG